MFEKIKDIIKISEGLDEIRGKLNTYTESVDSLNTEMKKFREELNLLQQNISVVKDKQSGLVDSFHESVQYFQEMGKEMKQTVYDFSVLRKDVQSQILEKFDEQLNTELITHLDSLKLNAKQYEEVHGKIASVAGTVKTLGDEIEKFNTISKNIKQEDFELTKFANKVLEMDKEKLELLRKVDTLERLISKMRQNQHQLR
jgi:chromosome segregation ATPase